VECDVTTQEAAKALGLLLQGNGNMLERLLSPLQPLQTPELPEMQALARGAISVRFFRHYSGFFRGCVREHHKAKEPVAKKLLYAYRVALTGVHLLRTGELETDVNRLGPEYGLPEVVELVAFKREHGEKSALPFDVDQRHRANLGRLEAMLQSARDDTTLPPRPENATAVSRWLIELRKANL
jgi:hypothetical protein